MQRSTKHINKYKKRWKSKKHKRSTNYKEGELRNKGRESLDVSPQALDQSMGSLNHLLIHYAYVHNL